MPSDVSKWKHHNGCCGKIFLWSDLSRKNLDGQNNEKEAMIFTPSLCSGDAHHVSYFFMLENYRQKAPWAVTTLRITRFIPAFLSVNIFISKRVLSRKGKIRIQAKVETSV